MLKKNDNIFQVIDVIFEQSCVSTQQWNLCNRNSFHYYVSVTYDMQGMR